MTDRLSRFARQAIKVEEAQRRILALAVPLGAEEAALGEAAGRRLRGPLIAPEDVPHFRRSGLDGFALRSADAGTASPQQPAVLRVIGESAAGCAMPPCVEPGTAVRIMTGALVPEGADAVVMFEQTDELEPGSSPRSTVRVKHAVQAGQNVAHPGDDLRRGEPLFAAGTLIGPGHVAVLAAFGWSRIPVYRRPVVGILSTGSELAGLEEPLAAGRVRNSNAPMLAAQTMLAGGEPRLFGIASDDPGQVRRAVADALSACDLVVTTGGVSVGDHDVMAALFREIGGYRTPTCACDSDSGERADGVLFDKVAMRPGSPTSAAAIGGKPLVALSGNPGACFVGFELFVRPALAAMQGESPSVAPLYAVADEHYPKGSPHDRYERARLFAAEGILRVRPCGPGKSSMMRSLPEANVLMVVPAGSSGIARGDPVRVIPVNGGAFPAPIQHETE